VCVDILQVTSVIERSSIGKMEELENCPCLNELHQALRWSAVRWLGGLSCIFLSADSDQCLVNIIRYEFCRPFSRNLGWFFLPQDFTLSRIKSSHLTEKNHQSPITKQETCNQIILTWLKFSVNTDWKLLHWFVNKKQSMLDCKFPINVWQEIFLTANDKRLRVFLEKFISLNKARTVYLWRLE
jgi:hypothetical protein